ncbi:MAG: alpha/beta fold hydrolase [Acidimicrobiales bacterium]
MSTGAQHGHVDADGVRIHYVEHGPESGPLVLLVHGFPELSYSWRNQLPVLADAGYHAVAIDVRGYGRSGKPPRVEDYRLVRHVADNVAVARHFGASRANPVVIVGHDWGAPISWTSVLLRPELFAGIVLLSVPYSPPGKRRPTRVFAELVGADNEFYMNYFQEPGRAEAEAEEDLRRWLAGFYYAASGDAPPGAGASMAIIPRGERLSDRLVALDRELPWLRAGELDVYVEEFERTGLTGGLNRYRNLDRDWEDLAWLREQPLCVPALFVGGERDGPTIWGANAISRFSETLADLRGSHILKGCGHWVQQERAAEVNQLLLEFLGDVRPVADRP